MDPLGPVCYLLLTTQISTLSFIYLVLLILGVAFFSFCETALLYCNRQRLKIQAEDGKKLSKLVLYLLEHHDHAIITILIGTNVINIVASVLATALSILILKSEGLATVASTVIMTIVIFIFGEILPKSIAQANPDPASKLVSIPLLVINIILTPISIIFLGLIKLIKKLAKVSDEEDTYSEDDFQDIIDEGADDGVLDEEEADIINNAVEFGDKVVRNIMTPIEDVFAIDVTHTTRHELLETIAETDYSRIPIYKDKKTNIVGILLVKEYLHKAMIKQSVSYRSCLIETLKVFDNMEIDALVDYLQSKQNHIAIVTDNQGSVVGLVTLEDALEELVGEFEETIAPGEVAHE